LNHSQLIALKMQRIIPYVFVM